MKKIGFIDLFIDEWHANNYPAWFKSSKFGGDFQLGYAFEVRNNGKRTLSQWCSDFSMKPAASIEEVVEKSDCICVLAPSNPEVHEEIAALPLASGKPLYIDKPFAPSRDAAIRIFKRAEEFNTPLMSSSALRFSDQLLQAKAEQFSGEKPTFAAITGGGRSFDEYGIHQIEMLVSTMGTGAQQVKLVTNDRQKVILVEYPDNRRATLTYSPEFDFTYMAGLTNSSIQLCKLTNYFPNLIDSMLQFFSTGQSPVPKEETIEIATILENAVKAIHA